MSEPQLLISNSKHLGGSTGFNPPKINIAAPVRHVDLEEYPFLFGRLGKNLNTHTHYIYLQVNSWVLYLFVKFVKYLWTTPKKNILAYVTHRNLSQINQNCRNIYNLRDVFTYIMCLRIVEPFGGANDAGPVSSRNWLIFPRAWMAMKTILRRAAPISTKHGISKEWNNSSVWWLNHPVEKYAREQAFIPTSL